MNRTASKIGLAVFLLLALAGAGWLFFWLIRPSNPKVGDSCHPSQPPFDVNLLGCVDSTSVLACSSGGRVVQNLCRGPEGCRQTDTSSYLDQRKTIYISCDTSLVEEGDPCAVQNNRVGACRVDHRSMLSCVSGQWHITAECRGKEGCGISFGSVKCDQSVGRLGEKCTGHPWQRLSEKVWHQPYACSEDSASLLLCEKGVFTRVSDCGGAGCSAGDGVIRCDERTSYMVGDACEEERAGACTDDKRTLLSCRSGQFVSERECGLGERCEVRGGLVNCFRAP